MNSISDFAQIGRKIIKITVFFDERLSDADIQEEIIAAISEIRRRHKGFMLPANSPFRKSIDEAKSNVLRLTFPLVVLSLRNKKETVMDLTLNLKITRLSSGAYTRYDSESSNSNRIDISMNISILFQRLVFPRRYAKDVVKSMNHELTHYYDPLAAIRGELLEVLDKFEDEEEVAAYFLIALHDLRIETLSNYNVKRHAQKVEIEVDKIHLFKIAMNKLAGQETQLDAFSIYKEAVRPLVQKVGMMIGFFIALSYAPDECLIYTREGGVFNLNALDKIMRKNTRFWIKNVPKKIFDKAYSDIKQTDQTSIVKLYDKACDKLKLSNRNRAIGWRRLLHLVHKAFKIQKKHYDKAAKKAGFPV